MFRPLWVVEAFIGSQGCFSHLNFLKVLWLGKGGISFRSHDISILTDDCNLSYDCFIYGSLFTYRLWHPTGKLYGPQQRHSSQEKYQDNWASQWGGWGPQESAKAHVWEWTHHAPTAWALEGLDISGHGQPHGEILVFTHMCWWIWPPAYTGEDSRPHIKWSSWDLKAGCLYTTIQVFNNLYWFSFTDAKNLVSWYNINVSCCGSGGHISKNGAHWAKIKVLAGLYSFWRF